MKKIFILIICTISLAFSQFTPHVIKFEYDRQLDEEPGEKAVVFHENYSASYIFVHEPVVQHIRMRAEKLLYYYPNSNIAIFMNNPDALIATQPVQLFISTGSDDLGLSNIGFEMNDYYLNSDTLIRSWELEGKNKDEYIKIDVFSNKEKVFKTITYDADDKIIKIVRLRDWINISNHYFPFEYNDT